MFVGAAQRDAGARWRSIGRIGRANRRARHAGVGLIEEVLAGAKIAREEIGVIAVGLGPGKASSCFAWPVWCAVMARCRSAQNCFSRISRSLSASVVGMVAVSMWPCAEDAGSSRNLKIFLLRVLHRCCADGAKNGWIG